MPLILLVLLAGVILGQTTQGPRVNVGTSTFLTSSGSTSLGFGGAEAGNFIATVTPLEAGAKVFNWTIQGVAFDGDTKLDWVTNFGINVNPGGSRSDGNTPNLFDTWEGHYCPSIGNCVMERHVGQANINGSIERPYTFTISESSGQIDQSFTAFTMDWNYSPNISTPRVQYMKWQALAFNVVQPVVFTFANNNYAGLVQSNAAGNANIPMISVNGSNQVALNPGGGSVVYTQGQHLFGTNAVIGLNAELDTVKTDGTIEKTLYLDGANQLRLQNLVASADLMFRTTSGRVIVTDHTGGSFLFVVNDSGSINSKVQHTFGSSSQSSFDGSGILQAAGYKSSDGSDGVTGSTCSAWKNGLCVAP